jgi:CheY-like chemotaxis protein/DNA-directed RNA polymerase specialized sigma24 family protein
MSVSTASVSNAIVPQLPYLRRFARALTGSQASGDAYAAATLDALLAGSAELGGDLEPRPGLYRVMLKIWRSVAVNLETPDAEASDAAGAAARNLGAMTPLPRVAFLLRSMEGFGLDQVAAILERPVAEVEVLIDRAGSEIAEQISSDVLIIEDEPVIAMDLEALLEDLGHNVVFIARTQREALTAIENQTPGLVLADIRLADGSSGLDAVNEILGFCQVPVVFITAYPDQLLTGERPEPAFLIVKPYRPETVKVVVSQALFFNRVAHAPGKATLVV